MLQFILRASFRKVKLISLAAACLSLVILYWIGEKGEALFFILHVFTLGIAHGALDRWLFNIVNPSNPIKKLTFYSSYLLIVGLVILVWWFSQSTALILFLIYSAWHFGEVEWNHLFKKVNQIQNGYAFIWGLFLFSSMFYLNSSETVQVVNIFSDLAISSVDFSLQTTSIIIIAWLSYSLIPFILKWTDVKNVIIQMANVLALSLIFYFFNLAISFAVFFFYFHSLPSLSFELKSIDKSDFRPTNYKSILMEMVILSLIPLLGGIGFILLDEKSLIESVLPVLIILGSAISFPHTFIYAWAVRRTSDSGISR